MKRKITYKKKSQNRLSMMLAIAVMLIILVVIFVQGIKLSKTLEGYDERKQELTQELSDEQKRTKDIQEYGKYTQTDEYVEKVARDKLGLVKDDEIVFKKDSNQ